LIPKLKPLVGFLFGNITIDACTNSLLFFLAEAVTSATIDVYNAVSGKMLPTPSKIHYLFNLRDISRVRNIFYRVIKSVHPLRYQILLLGLGLPRFVESQ